MTRHLSSLPHRWPFNINLLRKIHQQSRVFNRALSGFGQRVGNKLVADVATKCRFMELQGIDDAADNVDVGTVYSTHFDAFLICQSSIRIGGKPALRGMFFKSLAASARKIRSGGGV